MPFTGQGTGIRQADDVYFNSPQQGQTLLYRTTDPTSGSTVNKWYNLPLTITTTMIADSAITEPKLSISNTPTSGQVLSWNGTALVWAAPSGGSGGTGTGVLTVASNDSSAAIKALADYVCTGSNDQVIINQALRAASRAADGFGGSGMGGVQLVGPNFYIGNNGTGAITMYPSTHLMGAGPGTLIQPRWPSDLDRGAIELLNAGTGNTRVSNLSIGLGSGGARFNGHGIKYTGNGTANASDIGTGSDLFNSVDHVMVLFARRKAIWMTGASSTSQPSQVAHISHCLLWAAAQEAVMIDGDVDAHIVDCRANGGWSAPRYSLGGGSVRIANSKSYFAGNSPNGGVTNIDADGFYVASKRAELIGCAAQDNGRWGFNISTLADNVNIVGCVADSNSRIQANGGGFYIAANCSGQGLTAFDRGQTPSATQNRGFVFASSPQVNITGYAKAPQTPSGTVTLVVGTINTSNSYLRIVRVGDTVATETSF